MLIVVVPREENRSDGKDIAWIVSPTSSPPTALSNVSEQDTVYIMASYQTKGVNSPQYTDQLSSALYLGFTAFQHVVESLCLNNFTLCQNLPSGELHGNISMALETIVCNQTEANGMERQGTVCFQNSTLTNSPEQPDFSLHDSGLTQVREHLCFLSNKQRIMCRIYRSFRLICSHAGVTCPTVVAAVSMLIDVSTSNTDQRWKETLLLLCESLEEGKL